MDNREWKRRQRRQRWIWRKMRARRAIKNLPGIKHARERAHLLRRELAAPLARDILKSGRPPLGIPFGWTNPGAATDDNADEWIVLSHVYTTPQSFTLRQVLSGTDIGFENARDIIREWHRADYISLDECYTGHGPLLEVGEVLIQYGSLEPDQQLAYRIAIAGLNQWFTDGLHNTACSLLESLADQVWETNDAQIRGIEIYTNEGDDPDLWSALDFAGLIGGQIRPATTAYNGTEFYQDCKATGAEAEQTRRLIMDILPEHYTEEYDPTDPECYTDIDVQFWCFDLDDDIIPMMSELLTLIGDGFGFVNLARARFALWKQEREMRIVLDALATLQAMREETTGSK